MRIYTPLIGAMLAAGINVFQPAMGQESRNMADVYNAAIDQEAKPMQEKTDQVYTHKPEPNHFRMRTFPVTITSSGVTTEGIGRSIEYGDTSLYRIDDISNPLYAQM